MSLLPAQMGSDDTSAAAYEELRRHVVSGSTSGHFGLVLIVREGVYAWMKRNPIHSAPSFPSQDAVTGPRVSDEISASVVRLLASMALAGQKEKLRP